MSPNTGFSLPGLVGAVICRSCQQPGEQGLWCDVCARLTHMVCAKEYEGHIVCNACSTEWQLGLELEQGQREQLAQATAARQQKAEGLAMNLNSIVAQGAQLLGTGVGGVTAAAAGGGIALTAGIAKGLVAGAVAAWPRTAGKKSLPSQEELAARDQEDRRKEREEEAEERLQQTPQRPRAIGERPGGVVEFQDVWEDHEDQGGKDWQKTWSTEEVVQYVNDRFGEILPRLDQLENKVYKKTLRYDMTPAKPGEENLDGQELSDEENWWQQVPRGGSKPKAKIRNLYDERAALAETKIGGGLRPKLGRPSIGERPEPEVEDPGTARRSSEQEQRMTLEGLRKIHELSKLNFSKCRSESDNLQRFV